MVQKLNTKNLTTPESIANLQADIGHWVYNGLDCGVTLEILESIKPQLDELTLNTYAFSRALQAPIMDMQLRGTKIDLVERRRLIKEFKADSKRIEANLNRLFLEGYECEVDWRSNNSLIKFFYGTLGIDVIKKRRQSGKYTPSVDINALEVIDNYYYARIVVRHLMELRNIAKKLEFLTTKIDDDNCIRSTFNIAGTTTGRFASSEDVYETGTNLQNVGRSLRSVCCAREGMKFGNLDLEQADARNLGALCYNIFYESHGPEYAGAFLDAAESGDLHTAVAIGAYPHLPWTDSLSDNRAIADDHNNYAYRDFTYRDQAKRLGHGTNFYGKPPQMAKTTKIPIADVKEFQRNYFAQFGCIQDYHKWVRDQLVNESQLTTLFGRRRYFWNRANDDKTLRDAIAYAPQSMTADQINHGLLNLWRDNRVFPLIQVHDSILFEYPEELEEEIIPFALNAMTIPIKLKGDRIFAVPTDAEIGWNWGKAEKVLDPQTQKIISWENPAGLIKWNGTADARKNVDGEIRWMD